MTMKEFCRELFKASVVAVCGLCGFLTEAQGNHVLKAKTATGIQMGRI